jgi:hypothetical protein
MRINCDSKCLLNYNNINYPCLLENLSISGALVCDRGFPPATIRLGDKCGLLLSSDPLLCPGKYTSKVTRLGPSTIALHFLEIVF